MRSDRPVVVAKDSLEEPDGLGRSVRIVEHRVERHARGRDKRRQFLAVAVTVKTLSRVRSTFTATTLDEASVIEFGPVEHDVAVRVSRDRELPLPDEARAISAHERPCRCRSEILRWRRSCGEKAGTPA